MTYAASSMRRTKTVSITSGKGGVGKTTIVSNLAYNLARQGKRVLIFDGDLGMANVDIFFGVKSTGNIHQVLTGEKTIQEIVTELNPNIDLISGGSGVVELNRMNAFQRRALVDAVAEFDHQYDYLLIDTAPGISDNVLYLNAAVQKSAIVITPDPASLADSYALIKILHQEYKENKFSIICNQVRDEVEGMQLYSRFNEVVNRFLFIGLDYWGSISHDMAVKKSSQNQRLILKHEPYSEVSQQLMNISNKLERSLIKTDQKNGLQFFWDQVVGVA
ncbi:MAG: site-determining protein [Oligoflexia bacterium]|nr:MAG: site-determining protein [Oligoflexia bacterium]